MHKNTKNILEAYQHSFKIDENQREVERAVNILQKKFPGIEGIKPGYLWSGKDPEEDTSIHLGDAGEGGQIGEFDAANYYAYEFDPNEEIYRLGIHKDLEHVLDELGYFAEWYDSGTILAYKE